MAARANSSFSSRKASRAVVVLAALFCSICTFAQLPDFQLHITTTDEACAGNGQIQFSASGTQPGAAVKYLIYELPDMVTPIGVFFAPGFLNVGHGTFQIVATQTAGSQTNTQTQNVTIADIRTQLLYTITGTKVTCGSNGSMTVNIFSGIGAQYEIISGPVTAPLQDLPTFTGLPAGQYQVRVYDICGEAWVATHTLLTAMGNVGISQVETELTTLVNCESITLTNALTPETGTSLSYPVTLQYTVNPPGGGTPIVTTVTLNEGELEEQEFTTVLPYFGGAEFSYSVLITDACGNTTVSNQTVSNPFVGIIRKEAAGCDGFFFNYVLNNYLPPLIVEFLQAPAGFNPIDYNPGHPGPFTPPTGVIPYGNEDLALPYGFYSVRFTDLCGNSVTLDAGLEWIDEDPSVSVTQLPGCSSDHSNVNFGLLNYSFAAASITAGPPEFSTTYPVDVTSFINSTDGQLYLLALPAGNYTILLTDECGRTYTKDFLVPPLLTTVSYATRPDCTPGNSGVRIRGVNTILSSVTIVAAPAAYAHALPYDVSFNINPLEPDIFSMTGLPAGSYRFTVVDNCGVPHTVTAVLTGYAVTLNTYNVTPYCGSFDLEFHYASNAIDIFFYLQRKNPVTGEWGHPQTGAPYIEGTVPDLTNSYLLSNNTINYNISYLGDFRIIRKFKSFGNGGVELYHDCVEIIREFTFTNELRITDIQKTSCNGIFSDITITAEGFPPLTYQITEKNGIPFTVNNAGNNIFTNLETAIYNFQVFDTCGNQTNLLADIALLPSLVDIAQPGEISDIIECEDSSGNNTATFDLTQRNAFILNGLNAADYDLTFHATSDDAATDANPLPETFASAGQPVYVRVEYNGRSDCFDITSFNLVMHDFPEISTQTSMVICSEDSLTITADPGFDGYLWSTGAASQSIVVTEPGTYTVEYTKIIGGMTCTQSVSINVAPSKNAVIHHIDIVDWTDNENTITIILDDPGDGNFLYSLDNIHFQANNVFSGLKPGEYTVYINDTNGCDSATQIVHLLGYPKFFTPNDDGFNDFWQVYFARTEPHLQLHIFDRYGKLLKVFGAESPGWDGTYNGHTMPSTDYWFVAIRENGKEYRGHFAMKR